MFDVATARRRLEQRRETMAKLRGRHLTAREQLRNLHEALAEHESDCATKLNQPCDCGAGHFETKD